MVKSSLPLAATNVEMEEDPSVRLMSLLQIAESKSTAASVASMTASQQRLFALASSLSKMHSSSNDAYRCCEYLAQRARQLDTLTSPASDASTMLSHANNNLASTIVLMKEAKEKFDTVTDCEPAIEKLQNGVAEMEERRQRARNANGPAAAAAILKGTTKKGALSEQDVYAAGDAMEILRDAFDYFVERRSWRSAPTQLNGIERLYTAGQDAMCMLITTHLKRAGPATRSKRLATFKASGDRSMILPTKGDADLALQSAPITPPSEETAHETRQRLAAALQNRDLLKSIGEFEECQPIDARPLREMRSIFECLGSHGYNIGTVVRREPPGLHSMFGIPPNNVIRTEKVGSGYYTDMIKKPLKTGFPPVDAYGEARKEVAYASIDTYYRRVKNERKKKMEKAEPEAASDPGEEANAAARDAVRCLEHAMVVVAGEKHVFRTLVSPSLINRQNRQKEVEDESSSNGSGSKSSSSEDEESPFFRKACVAAYSHIAASVVDRALDILEVVFFKEGGIGSQGNTKTSSDNAGLTVRSAAAAAVAGLRMLDGVRMLGPSLAKLCEMNVDDGETISNSSLAAVLCIAIHRTTVKNTARTLENLAKAIQDDPMKGPLHRPKDASVSTVTADVIYAIRLVSPFDSAYKSVSKRRALPWDPNLGDESGELESYIRFLIMRLLNSLKGKALNYTKDGRDDGQAKSNLFMMNNAYFLLEGLGPDTESTTPVTESTNPEDFRIHGSWFVDKVNNLMESEKSKYLGHWEILNTHLTAVSSGELEYQKNNSEVLSHESGRLIKTRFTGFNNDFEKTYELHRKLCVVDPRLRLTIQQDVAKVFLPRYRRFYEKYTKIRFSKKHQDEYTKYSPDKIEDMLSNMFVDPENNAWQS